jgi:hypothetical protein
MQRLPAAGRNVFVVAVLLLGVTVPPALRAATWIGGSGIWDNSDTTHWSPAAVPGTGTVLSLTQSSATAIDITYAATTQTASPSNPAGTYYGALTVSNSGGGITTLYLDGTDLLPASANVTVDTGGRVSITGGTLYADQNFHFNAGEVVQSGGVVQARLYDVNLYPNAAGKTVTYTMSGGTLQVPGGRAIEIGSHNSAADPPGVSNFNLSGTAQIIGQTRVGRATGGPATLTQSGGILNGTGGGAYPLARQYFYIRPSGIYNLSGGFNGMWALGMSGGLLNMTGGTIDAFYDLEMLSGTPVATFSGGTATFRGLNLNTSGTATVNINTGGTVTIAGPSTTIGGGAGAATVTLNGGIINTSGGAQPLATDVGGLLDVVAGTISGVGNLTLKGGTFRQSDGSVSHSYDTHIGTVPGKSATFELQGGTHTGRNFLLGASYGGTGNPSLGGSGTALLTGGTLSISGSPLDTVGIYVSHPSAVVPSTLTLKGTTLAGNAGINVFPLGTFQGYGTVGIGAGRQLNNSGRIIADGDGVDRTLDFTSYSGVLSNPTDNASDKGWFAVNRGKLTLRAVTVPANGSVNWGESAADTDIDLINSLRLTSSAGVTAGTLTVSLLADDRSDVATAVAGLAALNPPFSSDTIGLFDLDLGTFAFGSGSLTLQARYDHTAISPFFPIGQLGLYLYDGSTWTDVLGSVDPVNYRITSTAISAATFGSGANAGLLAITIPEPGALALLALAAAAGLASRRRR